MPRAPGTSTALTGVTGQKAQTIRAFTLESGRGVEAYTTRPGKDRVDGANPLCVIWREHATSDDVDHVGNRRRRVKPGRRRPAEARRRDRREPRVRESRAGWTRAAFRWPRWGLFTIDTRRRRLRAAQGGHRRAAGAGVRGRGRGRRCAAGPRTTTTRCPRPRATRATSRRLRSTRRRRGGPPARSPADDDAMEEAGHLIALPRKDGSRGRREATPRPSADCAGARPSLKFAGRRATRPAFSSHGLECPRRPARAPAARDVPRRRSPESSRRRRRGHRGRRRTRFESATRSRRATSVT